MSVTREQIAAYADGELTGEERAAVEAAIAKDPALAAQVEAHRALKATLNAHFAPILDAPVPEHLAAMLQPATETAEVVSFANERAKRGLAPAVRRWVPYAGPALAASLVLAVWAPWQDDGLPQGYADSQLAAVLDTQLAATQGADVETRVLVSFENEDGEYCRAYSSTGNGGIACRDETGWQIEQQFALDGASATEFRQAGSEADLFAAAQSMAAGDVLDAAGELAAKERGWR